MSVEASARAFVTGPNVDEGMLNLVEMAFRAYDPCLGCATHAAGHIPLLVRVYDDRGDLVSRLSRGPDGRVRRDG
jgi:coenzyme F420-reducing hydrogenase alpha subunit